MVREPVEWLEPTPQTLPVSTIKLVRIHMGTQNLHDCWTKGLTAPCMRSLYNLRKFYL